MKIRNVEKIVREIIEKDIIARCDDFYLLVEVYHRINPEVVERPFMDVMLSHIEYGLPHFESVRRARAKLQSTDEKLKAPEEIIKLRKEKEQEMYEYALGGK